MSIISGGHCRHRRQKFRRQLKFRKRKRLLTVLREEEQILPIQLHELEGHPEGGVLRSVGRTASPHEPADHKDGEPAFHQVAVRRGHAAHPALSRPGPHQGFPDNPGRRVAVHFQVGTLRDPLFINVGGNFLRRHKVPERVVVEGLLVWVCKTSLINHINNSKEPS